MEKSEAETIYLPPPEQSGDRERAGKLHSDMKLVPTPPSLLNQLESRGQQGVGDAVPRSASAGQKRLEDASGKITCTFLPSSQSSKPKR